MMDNGNEIVLEEELNSNEKNLIKEPVFNEESLMKKPADFRISAFCSDGIWYSHTKLMQKAKATEEELNSWIEKNLANGMLVQSKTGAKSYRFPTESVIKWYKENNYSLDSQLIDSIYKVRIWDGITETEGFLNAPLREVGIVTFETADSKILQEIKDRLKGIARVRVFSANQYKAYGLSALYIKKIVKEVFDEYSPYTPAKIYSRSESSRREMVDFSKEFATNLATFYKNYAKNILKEKYMETIRIYIPDAEEQESRFILWVFEAVEKFNEFYAVPFSGYFDFCLKKWVYDIPVEHVGKDTNNFQKERKKAIKNLQKKLKLDEQSITDDLIIDEMKEISKKYHSITKKEFENLENNRQAWINLHNATTLTWDENSDEKTSRENISNHSSLVTQDLTSKEQNIMLSHNLSKGILKTMLDTGLYADGFNLLQQIDANDINLHIVESLDKEFIKHLATNIGIK